MEFSIDYNTGVSVAYDFVNVDDVYVENAETISDLSTDDNKSQSEEIVKNADEVLNNQTESDIIKDNIDEGGATNGERKETVYLRSADSGGSDNDTGREGKAVRTGKEIFRETSQEEIKRTDFVRHKGDKNTEIVFSQILPDDYTEEMISLAKKNSEINLETVFTDGKIELYDKNGNLIRIIEDGCYNKANRTIYINCQSKEKLENINEHEKVHAFKRINPTAYEDLLADDEIFVISNAINDTLLSKAKLDIINKAKKHSVKNGIEVFAKNLKEEYEQKGTIEKYSGYFKDDGEKVVTLMSNSTSNTAKATLQDNDVANDRKKLYDVYRRMKDRCSIRRRAPLFNVFGGKKVLPPKKSSGTHRL